MKQIGKLLLLGLGVLLLWALLHEPKELQDKIE